MFKWVNRYWYGINILIRVTKCRVMITITKTAAKEIGLARGRAGAEDKPLKIVVGVGGCSGGYKYGLGFVDETGEKETVVESQGIKIIVQNEDVEKLKGTTIDFVKSDMGAGFRVENPNPAPEGGGGCGCGKSETKSEGGGCCGSEKSSSKSKEGGCGCC